MSKGSIGLAFTVRTRTESPDQASIGPYARHEISRHVELALGHLRYHLTDVPPQSNSPPRTVLGAGHVGSETRRLIQELAPERAAPPNRVSRKAISVGVFHWRRSSSLCYTRNALPQYETRVKLNRVFFPR